MREVIQEFLVSIGIAADESSARKAEETVKRVENTARKADEARTKTSAEQAMERARIALKAEGVERASMAQIMAKRDEMTKTEEAHAKRREQHEAKQAKAQANAVAGMRTLVNVAAATAVAVQSVTIALAGYATHAAAKLEAMAYASDRTRSSIQDLKVFSHAVSQLGGSAGTALNDLESFAERLRANPQGYTAFLKSVGVEARDAQGNIRGAAELYKEFRKNVGEKPYEQQLLYAQEMGVSEQTWRATDPAKLAEEEARSRAKYARMGYDPDKAAEGAKGLQNALRDMFESVNIIGEKTASKIFADVGDNLKGFTTFLEQHGDQIAEILSKVAQMVLAVSKALLELLTSDKVKGGLDWLMGMFGHVEEGSGKWVADTEKIKAALEALAAFIATVFVAKITGAFADILKELKPLLLLLAPVLAALGIPIAGTIAVGAALGGLGDPSKSVNGTGGRPDYQLNPGDELPGVGGGTPAPAGGEGAMARMKRLGRSALNAIGIGGGAKIGNWWTPERQQHAVDTLTKGGVSELGAKALVARWSAVEAAGGPASVNPRSGAFGIAQWLSADRLAGIRGNTNFDDQLAYALKELNSTEGKALRKLNSAKTPAEAAIGASMYERAENYDPRTGVDDFTGKTADAMSKLKVRSDASGGTLPSLPNLSGAVQKFGDGMNRLDMDKFRGIGAATQGFDPSQFLNAPPAGSSTSNDNSVRQQSYKGGDTNVTINTHGDVRETAELWRRHGERQKADDLRYAASMFG